MGISIQSIDFDLTSSRKWIVTSSKDCSCRLWSTSTSKCVALAAGHTDAVSSIALSHRLSTYASNCAIFVSGGGDKVLKRWRLLSEFDSYPGDPIELSPTHSVRAHDKDINTIAISPNDALIATGSHDTRIRLWNSQDLSAIITLAGHRKSVWCVRFSPVDKCLASSSGDRTLKLWSLVDYTCLRTLQGHTASVLCLQFVRHGMQIVSAAADGLLYLWTIRNGERENVLDQHTEKVWGLEKLQFNDAEILLSCGSDSQIISWYDATPEEEQVRLESQEKTMILEQQLGNFIRSKRYPEVRFHFLCLLIHLP
jgi:U3 small nucleolar RNA-associated protein 13